MFHSIVYGFAGDMVQMRGDIYIVYQNRRITFKATSYSEQIFRFLGTMFQRRH